MATDIERRKAFSVLHPLCVQLTSNPSTEILTTLKQALLTISPSIVDELQEFVLFALRIMFKTLKNRPQKFKIEFFQCLNTLLTKIKDFDDTGTFYEISNNILLSISPPPLIDEQADISNQTDVICEEIKLEGVRALDLIFSNATVGVLLSFYGYSSSVPFLGHAVSVLLNFIEKEKLRSLRLASMMALLRISFCCVEGPDGKAFSPKFPNLEDDPSVDESPPLREKFCLRHSKDSTGNMVEPGRQQLSALASHIFASFLPGISMTLTKVIIGDTKQGQVVMAYAVMALTRILERTFSDAVLTNLKGKKSPAMEVNDNRRELLVSITDEWADGTSRKLGLLLDKVLTSASCSDGWRIRLELLKMSEALLSNCCRSLSHVSEKLLNILISSLVNEEPVVRGLALQLVQSLNSKLFNGTNCNDLTDLLEENFLKSIENLPTMLSSPNDPKKLTGLRLLQGYLEVLGHRSEVLMSSAFLMEKFLKSLFYLLEFDCTSLVVCDNAGDDLQLLRSGTPHDRLPPYSFGRFSDDRITEEVVKALNLIGQLWDLPSVVDQLLRAMIDYGKFKKQAAYCLVHVLNGARMGSVGKKEEPGDLDSDGRRLESMVDCIVGQVLDGTFWSQACEPQRAPLARPGAKKEFDLDARLLFIDQGSEVGKGPTTRKESDRAATNLRETREEVTFACLLLDVIGASALLSGRSFEPKIQRVLVPLLERIGSSRYDVRLRALRALFDVSRATSMRAEEPGGVSPTPPNPLGTGRIREDDRTSDDVIVEMLVRCSDYLMSSIIPRLRMVPSNPRVLVAMTVVVELGTPRVDPKAPISMRQPFDETPHLCLMRVMSDSFKQIMTSFDRHHGFFCLQFWRLLLGLAQLVARSVHLERADQMPEVEEEQLQQETPSGRATNEASTLVDYVKELERNRRIVESCGNDSGGEDGDGDGGCGDGKNVYEKMAKDVEKERLEVEGEVEEEKKAEIPFYLAMLEQILDRCQHFLIFPEPQIRMITMETVRTVCPVMKPFQDNLLPLVHKIWAPLVRRFSDEEHYVCMKAFETLEAVTDSAGDFVRRRIAKDVVPRVVDLLLSSAKKSYRAPPNYKFSTSHQLQLSALKNIGNICRQACIEGPSLWQMMQACTSYLSALQPKALQEACLSAFQEFIGTDPDTVWLLLTEVYHPTSTLVPPAGSGLEPIKLRGDSNRNEYTDNATVLYKILETP